MNMHGGAHSSWINYIRNSLQALLLSGVASYSSYGIACSGAGGHITVDNNSWKTVCTLRAHKKGVHNTPFSNQACISPSWNHDEGHSVTSHFCFWGAVGGGGYLKLWIKEKVYSQITNCGLVKIDDGHAHKRIQVDLPDISNTCPDLELAVTHLEGCEKSPDNCQITIQVNNRQ